MEVDMGKLLTGVEEVLKIDYRDNTTEEDKPHFEKAIAFVQSDKALNEMRQFFERYERRRF